MDPLMVGILFVLVCALFVGSGKAYKSYSDKVLVPKARMQLLEDTVDKVAAHNVANANKDEGSDNEDDEIIKDGIGKELTKSFQETFGSVRQLPPQISLADALREDHPINTHIGSPFKSQRREPFHSGPYAHEMTKDEWSFVQEQYQKAIQRNTDETISLGANLTAVKEIEDQLHRQVEAYSKARKQVSGSREDPYKGEFEKLKGATDSNDGSDSSEQTSKNTTKKKTDERNVGDDAGGKSVEDSQSGYPDPPSETVLHPNPFAEGNEGDEAVKIEKDHPLNSSTSAETSDSVDDTENSLTKEEIRQKKLEKAALSYNKMKENLRRNSADSGLSQLQLEKEIDREWG